MSRNLLKELGVSTDVQALDPTRRAELRLRSLSRRKVVTPMWFVIALTMSAITQ